LRKVIWALITLGALDEICIYSWLCDCSDLCGGTYDLRCRQRNVIDFESTPTGIYSVLNISGVTITYTGGTGTFNVDNQSPGFPVSGHNLISFFQNPGVAPFKAAFSDPGITSVQIGVGDYDADDDNDFLQAYDAGNNLLDADYRFNPASTFGGGYLSVSSASAISYILFWDEEPFAGAVYWDNLTFTSTVSEVPEPLTVSLFSAGLIGAAVMRRRRKANKA